MCNVASQKKCQNYSYQIIQKWVWLQIVGRLSLLIYFTLFLQKTCISFVRYKKVLQFAWHSVFMTIKYNLPFQSNLFYFQNPVLTIDLTTMSLISYSLCISYPLQGKPFPSLVFRFHFVPSSKSSASITHFYVHISQLLPLLNSHFRFHILLLYYVSQPALKNLTIMFI